MAAMTFSMGSRYMTVSNSAIMTSSMVF
jgi:hypothetical protein